MVGVEGGEATDRDLQTAVQAFTALGLCEQLAEAAASLGWKTPSVIQEQAVPHLLAGKDVIGLAQTGSGKTGAFALPILQGFSLKSLRHLVLDEADRLLDMDFEQEIDQILKVIPKERQTQLFSATMTNKVAKLQRASLQSPVKVEVAHKYSTVDTLRQQYAFIPAKHKDCYLAYILNDLSGSTAIIFTRTCDSTRRLSLMLRNLGWGALPIHGQMTQPKRLAALNKFKAGERNILVATDVASRGLDIPSVDMVINYDVPPNSKDYVHRVGRTARAGRAGRAITIVTQYDVELFQRIEQLIGVRMEQYECDGEAVLIMLERVNEAQRIATAQMREKDRGRKGGRKGTVDDGDDADDGARGGGKKRTRRY